MACQERGEHTVHRNTTGWWWTGDMWGWSNG
jgi:hypothetical protein